MDTVNGMRLFVRVVETGSFSKASAGLAITQPTATKHIAALERRLKARLFHRSTRGATPTEVGSAYYDKCKAILDQLDEADDLARLVQSRVRGTLRISTSVAFGRRVLTPLVLRFMALHPELAIDLSFDDRYVNLVEQGVDVALRMGRLADSQLGARHLGLNPWVLVAAPAYLERQGTPRAPKDLAGHGALIYSTVQGDDRWHFTRTAGSGGAGAGANVPGASARGRRDETVSVGVRGPLRSNNLSALLAAARAGMGIAALPRYVAHESLQARAVKPLLEAWALPSQEMHAVFPSPKLVPQKVSGFVAWLQGQFEGDWWARRW
ncbi:MAG: LysR family transcriptional regulator [Rubrivivax sp.]|nr:LysR family transcriptional regulator [Rubrivivax sp.]